MATKTTKTTQTAATTQAAYAQILEQAEGLSKLITGARSQLHPLTLPASVTAALVEAREALFAAAREMEATMTSPR